MTPEERDRKLLLCFECLTIMDAQEKVRNGGKLTNEEIQLIKET